MRPSRSGTGLLTLVVVGYAFLWTPIIVFGLFSFNSNAFGVKWESLTSQWYVELFQETAIMDSVVTSLVIAGVTTLIATAIGTVAGYGLYKYKFTGRRVLRMSILLPITVPYVIMAGALLVYFTSIAHVPLGSTNR